ncbi:pentatricopeptide repeat-containing protein At1g32415, mitochondrial [Prosopis cineraria]|uniref:pentatricopeptide repeat-containing protein At1g32415, mitochondrial n=1 Tax=Prosopis cineraria TaxID=364024 RepID=UPI0024106985|nr:pentatricopeptide repeat-containing protein At1g32415, mitochondrial [Prosopis cineraria]
MPAYCFTGFRLPSFSKISSHLQSRKNCSLPLPAQVEFPWKNDPQPIFDDSLLLHYLSKRWHQEARNFLETTHRADLHKQLILWTSLVSKFSREGYVDEARVLFDIMPRRNIVTYNAMLSGYLQSGRLNEACKFFKQMPYKNVVSWTSILSGLADSGRIGDARKVFGVMLERNVVSWNSLVTGLISNGRLEEARQVFDQIPDKNMVSWNAMISGYAKNDRMEEARILFDEMKYKNVITWTSMISGYCRVGNVGEAHSLFWSMPEKNVVSWTAMISGFTWNGLYEEALLLFQRMRFSDAQPNGETFISLAYACARLGFSCLGKQLHAQMLIKGCDRDDFDGRLCRSLIQMYSVFGLMDFANKIFDKNSTNYDSQSVNSMINGYIKIGQLHKARILFDKIPIQNRIAWTCMITGYFNAGEILQAWHIFETMPDRDAIAWASMIYGYVQNELIPEATSLFAEMRSQGVSPLNSTYSVLFGAMGAMAYLDQGRQLHGLKIKTVYEYDLILENSLISMYAKCGEIGDAYNVFSNMTYRDIVSWNSMIMGLSDHGMSSETLKVYETMLELGIYPDSVTFLGILTACGNAGLVDKGWELFSTMTNDYALQPGLGHCISMINLLGRAGKVKEAEEFVFKLPIESNRDIWGALLGVCGLSKTDSNVAKHAAKRLFELDPVNAAGYVTLCNICAVSGMHIEETKLRRKMSLKGVMKTPGCSWIILRGRVHIFLSGDRLNPQVEEMLFLLSGNEID